MQRTELACCAFCSAADGSAHIVAGRTLLPVCCDALGGADFPGSGVTASPGLQLV
jgi:hypothetical protein